MSTFVRPNPASGRADFNLFLRDEEVKVVRENLGIFRRIDQDRKKWLLSEGYHNNEFTYYGRVKAEFGDSTPVLKEGSRVLDWGCSVGVTTIELANLHKGCEVTGLEVRGYLKCFTDHIIAQVKADPSYLGNRIPPELRRAIKVPERLLLPKEFLVADGFKAPFPDHSFDAVYCMNNLYYVLNTLDDHRRFERFHQVIRLVRPGGYFMLSGGGTVGTDGSSSDLMMMVLRKEKEGMKPVRMNASDWNGRARSEMVLEACKKDFCTTDWL
ncbi:MAG: class I SAM-dependent methyltransferase [Candidatus Micrarchaeota archaeon]|nr:class I SAM-dependent methyltransferase [Candidatus Micrarchaeota archaeon]